MLALQHRSSLRVSDRLAIVPAHVCTTANSQSAVLLISADDYRWVPVNARGWRPLVGNIEGHYSAERGS